MGHIFPQNSSTAFRPRSTNLTFFSNRSAAFRSAALSIPPTTSGTRPLNVAQKKSASIRASPPISTHSVLGIRSGSRISPIGFSMQGSNPSSSTLKSRRPISMAATVALVHLNPYPRADLAISSYDIAGDPELRPTCNCSPAQIMRHDIG